MRKLLIPLLLSLAFFTAVNGQHIKGPKELKVTSESSNESIALAKYLKNNGVVKYSAYWCPNCLDQSELFGKEAYKELNVVECAPEGKNSQTQLCIDKNIKGFPSWEINGKIIIGVQTLKDLSELTGFKY
tara:strand:- start:813 stop:1202 length:390 start_codon:yes stop_codon:yes gene_type:complete